MMIENLIESELFPAKDEGIRDEGQYYPKNISTIAMVSRAKLSPAQIAVYDMLCCLYNLKEEFAYPSYDYMAIILGIESRTAKLAVKKLVELKLVKKEIRNSENGGNNTNKYIPYCIKISGNYFQEIKKNGKAQKTKIRNEGSDKSLRECKTDHPFQCRTDHPYSDELNTQIKEKNKKVIKELTNISLQLTNNKSETNSSKFTFIPPIPHNIPGMPVSIRTTSVGNEIEKNRNSYSEYFPSDQSSFRNLENNIQSPQVKEYHSLSILGILEEYQQDQLYFTAPIHIQKIYDLVIKVNKDLGFKTRNWRLNELDLKNLKQICEIEKAEHFMNHIIKICSRLKNCGKELGVSYFIKKYKDQSEFSGVGSLV
jgi:predicted transcriptional regulator